MSNLDFVRKLYNGKNCYSDHMAIKELELIHIPSNVENIIIDMVKSNKIIFLTGNPGDGKTFIIKSIKEKINSLDVYIETDLSQIENYNGIAEKIVELYKIGKPAILAVNEYPFMQLCKSIKVINPNIYNEIQNIRKNSIIYDLPNDTINKIAIIDLNDRNILDRDHRLSDNILTRICELLEADDNISKNLSYNLLAVKNEVVRKQLLRLFDLAAISCQHFAIRDILGAFSFILTACETEEYKDMLYYDAIFEGSNSFLEVIQQFDPIYLSKPSLDEQLWNGEVDDGWSLEKPYQYPEDEKFYDDMEASMTIFNSIKRKYYFENIHGEELYSLQPSEIFECTNMFVNIERKPKLIKEKIIKCINKLFLPSSNERKHLYIWTTHRFDMSIEPSVAVSSRYIDASSLEVKMPRLADWLDGMEYMPDHLLLKPKGKDSPVLKMNIDFLRTLNAIESGYPISLLSSHYEQTAALFLQRLCETDLTEENDDGMVMIASRKKSYKKTIFIEDGKYNFDMEE